MYSGLARLNARVKFAHRVINMKNPPMTDRNSHILVTGAGGFIGHHLVNTLKAQGNVVRGVDIRDPAFAPTAADEFLQLDLRVSENALEVTEGIDAVYMLAADMGGMGFISEHPARILHNNALINTHTIEAARVNGVHRVFFASSACVYPEFLQMDAEVIPLKEDDAYPAQPQDAYGWEKLLAEQLCHNYRNDFGLETRVARFHNVYGPLGSWEGGREKAPAAICRKVAMAKLTNNPEVEIWGDGAQTRSFCYVDDAVEAMTRLMQSDFAEPLNIGQTRTITINELVDMVAEIAEVAITKKYISGPQGVRGRSSDNTRIREVLGWEPQITLEEGMAQTYAWIEEQVRLKLAQETLLPNADA